MSNSVRFLIFGSAFGLSFPLMATVLDFVFAPGPDGIFTRHLNNPLLLIIDTAPIFLGLFSYIGGRYADRQIHAEQVAFEAMQDKEKKQREAADLLAAQNLELHELNRTLDGLVYTASHDLKTPVVNFKGMITMLRTLQGRPGSEAMVAEVIGRMDKAADRFQATISDLLDISRVERQDSVPAEKVNLKEIMIGLWASVEEVAKAKSATIDLDGMTANLCMLPPRAIDSILLNLLTNSLKYSDPDRPPHITVSTSVQGHNILLSFRDNGLGIDVEAQGEKLFRMFSRLHTTSEGSGIGLYIVKRTLQKLGGDIRLESAVGVGTTFFLTIPNHS